MPVLNLKSFNAKIALATKKIPEEMVRTAQKKLVIDLVTGIIEKSIVDTGLSRGNWHVSFGAPDNFINEIKAPHEVLKEIEAQLTHLTPFQIVYVQNNIAYISYLEEGTPKVPAVAMVARTLAELEAGL